ncbi:MAG: 50S ribosomal protein L15 [Chitinophagales bacterium]|jgi:large subunit ribosomal protein L15|nr:50S ribosomal protein L15 [Bacteroidota bacterium]MBK7566382.1 50S ribosomal protein L15 [Bacteroidota bacterium]MBP8915731.1 50S ribosomal protein L15 [Chitinophagales bacterium]MBP9220416.1 50S ribosomal protein L15 [Chitinophagales bacterium]
MDLSNLKPADGSIKKRHRVGRGQGSGWGETSKRGFKGAGSRSGYSRKRGHEGGQMPLQRRLPKRGFNNKNFEVKYVTLNLDQIQSLVEKYEITRFDEDVLRANRILKSDERLKILGRGELKAKVEIWAHAHSETAKKAVEEAGGTINVIG